MNFKLIKDILRIGIGSVFIIAAILKLISIDEFDIYIYSFGILNFLVTSIFSRFLIAGEIILGFLLIFKICYKFTWRATMTILILFTFFLTYTLVFRNDANCHCFGDLIELSPIESIIKNLVIIGLLIFVKEQQSSDNRSRSRFQHPLVFSLLPLVIVFIISPPDTIYKIIYSTEKEISTVDLYDSFNNVVSVNSQQPIANSQLIAIVSSTCKYCHLGVKKLSMIMKRMGMNAADVNIFIWGSDDSILNFIKETDTENYSYWKIDPKQAIDITYGRFPIFIWMEDDEVVMIGDFRDINEDNLQLSINNEVDS